MAAVTPVVRKFEVVSGEATAGVPGNNDADSGVLADNAAMPATTANLSEPSGQRFFGVTCRLAMLDTRV